jgi:hypothetical protein
VASRIGETKRHKAVITSKTLVAAAALLLLVVAVPLLIHFMSGSPSPNNPPATVVVTPSNPSTLSPSNVPASSEVTNPAVPQEGQNQVTIDVQQGTAEVWQDGKMVGQTPYVVSKALGDSVQLVLRQSGYQDLPVQFDVTERSEYIYPMQRSGPPQ